MRKIGIPLKLFALLSLLALVLLLIPMLKAAEFDVPSADDYNNGLRTYQVWSSTGSLSKVIKAGWERVYDLYYSWQGTFTAIFLFTLNPMIFGEQYYCIGAWVIIITLTAGNFALVFAVFRKLFGTDKSECTIIASVWTIICTQFLPRASQGIYWYTGAVYYTFFFGLLGFALSILTAFIFRKAGDHGIGKLILVSFLLFFIGGGNLVTGLTTAVTLISIEMLLIILKKKDWKPILIPLLCFAISFGFNVAAPGNAVRQGFFPQPGLFQAVLLSFRQVIKFLPDWFSVPVIALILLLIPIFWMTAVRTDFHFPLPGLVSLYSFCLSGVMFYPPVYAMTDHNLDHLGRITNIIFFGEVFLAIFNICYWVGWLVKKGYLPDRFFPAAGKKRFSLIYLFVILLVFFAGMTQIKWFDVTDISILRTYRNGDMGNYYHTYRQRLEILKDPEIKDAVLKRFPCRPYVLFFNELSPDADGNLDISRWYRKNSVIIR